MRLAPMRYKNYTWPHNPEIYAVESRRKIAVHKIPYGRCVMQDLGQSYRVLRGEGVFSGENAYQEFLKLEEVFRENGSGLLVHPIWQAERAWFVELVVEEEPLPDFVKYRFVFWEDWSGYNSGLTENDDGGTAPWNKGGETSDAGENDSGVYVVKKGDTMWGIAARYGISLADLIATNPQIKNPNLIYPGSQVILP